MNEKVILGIISIITALSPIIFNYIFKRLETKNESSLRSRILDEAHKRFDFLNKYFQVQSAFLDGEKLAALRNQLSDEAIQIKNAVSQSYKEPEINEQGKLSAFQKTFLTFKPLTAWGWLLLIVCYVDSVFIFFALIGFALDPVTNQFSGAAFLASLTDTDALTGILFFIGILVICRWLAVRSYNRTFERRRRVSEARLEGVADKVH